MDETEESSVGHLEDEALKRRRMIEELRNKRKQAHSDNQQEQIGQDKVQLPKYEAISVLTKVSHIMMVIFVF